MTEGRDRPATHAVGVRNLEESDNVVTVTKKVVLRQLCLRLIR